MLVQFWPNQEKNERHRQILTGQPVHCDSAVFKVGLLFFVVVCGPALTAEYNAKVYSRGRGEGIF